MTETVDGVAATAQFFDDIRMENTGKLILIGYYHGELIIHPTSPPVDRLSILVTAKLPRDYPMSEYGVRVEMPGLPVMEQKFPSPPPPDLSSKPQSHFSCVLIQSVVQMRFIPLRVNDKIDVWFQFGEQSLAAGRLYINSPRTDNPPQGYHAVLL